MRSIALAVMLAGCFSSARSPHRWTKLEIALATAYVAATVVDMRQTMGRGGITYHCDEQNPLIGKCGEGPISAPTYFAITYVVFGGAASIMDERYRLSFLGALAGIETANVVRNNSLGYGW